MDRYDPYTDKFLRDTQYNIHGTNLAEVGTDAISRQQAIDALTEDMPSAYTPDGSHPADEGIFMAQEIYADCIQTLKELPSAEPKRIRGKWIPITNGRLGHECDQCHEYAPSYESGNEYLSRFCPNCGAKMEVTE